MIAKIAVSAATFAIDKPYSYHVPEGMALVPGMRVTVPFGRGNRRSEGVVLALEEGEDRSLKAVEQKSRCCRPMACAWRPFSGNAISAPFMTASGPCCPVVCGSGSRHPLP